MARFEDLPLRPCVGVMLLNAEGRVFIGRRIGNPPGLDPEQAWQMPQGGIDEGETPLEAALRELREETNVRSVALLAEAPDWYSYDLPPAFRGKAWKGRYRGQTQRWFAFRLTGPESEIDIANPTGASHAEFDAWRWERMSALPDLIIPFKRPVYEQVIAAFRGLAP